MVLRYRSSAWLVCFSYVLRIKLIFRFGEEKNFPLARSIEDLLPRWTWAYFSWPIPGVDGTLDLSGIFFDIFSCWVMSTPCPCTDQVVMVPSMAISCLHTTNLEMQQWSHYRVILCGPCQACQRPRSWEQLKKRNNFTAVFGFSTYEQGGRVYSGVALLSHAGI